MSPIDSLIVMHQGKKSHGCKVDKKKHPIRCGPYAEISVKRQLTSFVSSLESARVSNLDAVYSFFPFCSFPVPFFFIVSVRAVRLFETEKKTTGGLWLPIDMRSN